MRALLLNCTLKPSAKGDSSTDKLLREVAAELHVLQVSTEIVRVADYDVRPGVTADEGDGDQWPQIRQKLLDTDILVLGSPIWMGQPSSVAKRVLERLDAFLSETDDEQHMPTHGKVAGVAVVGNEDGAHHVCAELYQALNDVGYTIAASASTYWVGEAMNSTDYKDLPKVPDKTRGTTKTLARTTTHLARLLKHANYPSLRDDA